MRNISVDELKEILRLHKLWLDNELNGKRADLRYADLFNADLSNADLSNANLFNADLNNANLNNANLSYANLSNADLSNADLSNADLFSADLNNANLNNANLSYANLRDADLRYANLRYAHLNNADLRYANLFNADLRYADLRCADLFSADLRDTDLYDANLSGAKNIPFLPQCQVCPEEGSFIGFKKVNNYIIKLEIPENAKRSSATTRKCRCEFAKVLSITNLDGNDSGLTEITNENYQLCTYKIGEIVYPDSFDDDRWNECSHGIHFFITRQEAIDY